MKANISLNASRALRSRGTIMPLLAMSIVVMVGFLALAIDLGMLAVAKTQTQQAADLAVLYGPWRHRGWERPASTTTRPRPRPMQKHLELQRGPEPVGAFVAAPAHVRFVRLQPDHAVVQRQLPADHRGADDRGRGHGHHDQPARCVQQDLRVVTPRPAKRLRRVAERITRPEWNWCERMED